MNDQTSIAIAEPASHGTMYTGAVSAGTVWYLGLGDILAIIAAIATVIGAGFSIYFGLRREYRQRELHKLQVKRLSKEESDG